MNKGSVIRRRYLGTLALDRIGVFLAASSANYLKISGEDESERFCSRGQEYACLFFTYKEFFFFSNVCMFIKRYQGANVKISITLIKIKVSINIGAEDLQGIIRKTY